MPMAVGDVRAEARGDWLIERVVATGSLVVRKLGGDRAGEIAAHRYLSSPHVSVQAIVATLAWRTAEQCAGRDIVVIQDTTEINFAGRAARRDGFGPGGNGSDPGFFIHPVLAVDVASEAVIGLADVKIWTRAAEPAGARRQRGLADKESMRWLEGCAAAAEVLGAAASLTMIADRESDIYELFASRPQRLDLIVRAAQNRALEDGGRLFDALLEAPVLKCQNVAVAAPRPGGKGRIAKVEIKAGAVRIKQPRNGQRDHRQPDHLDLMLVEAREIDAPQGKTALCWRLFTTHGIKTPEDAARIVALYRLRWRIEQLFRALKSHGLRLEESQLTGVKRMFVLATIALAAAVRTSQFVDARDGSPRPATDAVDRALLEPIARLIVKLEGKTQRQKNPHPAQSLAWLSWAVARLGGWNCYYKPPGPKTMRDGWTHLATFLAGYSFATMANANV